MSTEGPAFFCRSISSSGSARPPSDATTWIPASAPHGIRAAATGTAARYEINDRREDEGRLRADDIDASAHANGKRTFVAARAAVAPSTNGDGNAKAIEVLQGEGSDLLIESDGAQPLEDLDREWGV